MSISTKKKRFEGLIHFKDAFRQVAVCLQASLKDAFATETQSPLIATLNQEQEDVYFLLFSTDNEVGLVNSLSELKEHHLLTYIHQVVSEELAPKIEWHKYKSQFTAWLDASDQIAVNFFYSMVSQACYRQGSVDLSRNHPWGSYLERYQGSTKKKRELWLQESYNRHHTDESRLQNLITLMRAGEALFKTLNFTSLSSDGSRIHLILEGTFKPLKEDLSQMVRNTRLLPAHVIAINLTDKQQLSFSLPVQSVSEIKVKGMFIMRNKF